MKKLTLALALSLVVVLGIIPTASAANEFNLTASPLPIDLSVKPGGTVETPLRIQNTGTEAVKVKVSLMKFRANGTSGKPEILDPTAADDYIKWVHFSETSFVAEPNVWHTVNMTIKTPKEAAFGYYYAVIFSQENSNKPVVSGQHSVLTGAVATLVLLDVNAPGEKRELSVTSFRATKKVYDYLPASFTITVHNSGNTHAAPFGDVFISRNKTKDIAHLAINTAGGNILPGTDRTFEVSWEDGFPAYKTRKDNGQIVSDKNGKPIKSLEWGGVSLNKFRFGRYHAHMVLTYNDGTRDVPIEGDLTFWVVPWKLLLVTLLVVLLALTGLYAVTRSTIKRIRNMKKV
jgi:hypothetical protein